MFLVQTYLADILFFRKKTSIFFPLEWFLYLFKRTSFSLDIRVLCLLASSYSTPQRVWAVKKWVFLLSVTHLHYFFANKTHLFKVMVFPVVMYGCESWTIKIAEHWRIDVFELWCWRRLLRVPWTARRSNQSILEEISPGCSLERLMLKLKLQYFGHLMWWVDSLEKTLMLGGIGGRRKEGDDRGWDGWMHHRLDGREFK